MQQYNNRAGKQRIAYQKAVFLTLLALLLISCSPKQITPTPTTRPDGKKAALVDQIALTNPNPQFTEQALAYLSEAGFSTDVYEGEDITVEFYRTLPEKGYQLILFRTHATNVLNERIQGGLRQEQVRQGATSKPHRARQDFLRPFDRLRT
jgi:hypothetical protein